MKCFFVSAGVFHTQIKPRRPVLKRILLPILPETQREKYTADFEIEGLSFHLVSPDIRDILVSLHQEIKASNQASANKDTQAKDRSFTEGVSFVSNPKSLKWTKLGEGLTCTVWQVCLPSGQMIGIKRMLYADAAQLVSYALECTTTQVCTSGIL